MIKTEEGGIGVGKGEENVVEVEEEYWKGEESTI